MAVFILSTLRYYLAGLYRRTAENHLLLFASGLSFSTLLCVIPFILILFSILGQVVDSGVVQDNINQLIQTIIPYEEVAGFVMRFTAERVSEFIAFKGIAGVLGAAGLLFFASGLFSSMKTALNKVYRMSDEEHPALSALWDMALVLVVIVFLLLSVLILPALEGVKEFTFRRDLPGYQVLEILRGALFYAVTLALVFSVFYALYRFVPSARIDKTRAFVSALCATALWELSKQAFGFYITHFFTLERIYGAYLLLVVSALWIYCSSLVFILSAEIGQLYSERKTTRWVRLKAYFAKRKFGKAR